MYQLVVVEKGQYGFVYKNNERRVLDHPFKTYVEALAAAKRRYLMELQVKDPDLKPENLEGTYEDFIVTVNCGKYANFTDHYFIEEIEVKTMEKMYQLVVVENGQYGVVHRDNEREILEAFESYEQALQEAEGKYRMLELMSGPQDKLEGSPKDFVNTVMKDGRALFSDHYFIEEVK